MLEEFDHASLRLTKVLRAGLNFIRSSAINFTGHFVNGQNDTKYSRVVLIL